MHNSLSTTSPTPGLQLRTWLLLGLQSFGGGIATLTLIRETFVERRSWITADEYTRYWSLVQLAPGINLLALTILIGRRTAGNLGIAIALFGLLAPSAAITILLTAFYSHIQHAHWLQSALRGIVPATIGVGLVTAFRSAMPAVADSRLEGFGSLALSALVLIASGAAALAFPRSVAAVLLLAGSTMAIHGAMRRRAPTSAEVVP